MLERTAIKFIAIIFTTLISLTGSIHTKHQEQLALMPTISPLTIVYQPSITLPAPSTTVTSTSTTLAPPTAIRNPSKEVPKDPKKRCPSMEPLFEQYGLYPIETFSYIAWRESGCRPHAVNAKWNSAGEVIWTLNKNGSIDRGLLQINSSWKSLVAKVCKSPPGDLEVLFQLDCNLRVGRYLLGDGSGLSNWGL